MDLNFEEPWVRLSDKGDVFKPSMAYRASGRRVIKHRADAPHLAVCLPIGNKEDSIVKVNGDERKVVESYRSPGLIPVELMVNSMQVMQPLNVTTTWLVTKNNLSSILREQMTEQALELGVNFIFYWDDDVLLPSNTLYRMMNWMSHYPDIGAITGVVWTRTNPSEPILYKHAGSGSYWGFDRDPEAPPEDIYSAGAGCVLARASVVAKMSKPRWADQRTGNPDGSTIGVIGHDVRFFRNMKEETGFRTVVDGSIQCSHFDVKSQEIYRMPDDMPDMKTTRENSQFWAKVEEVPQNQSVDEIKGALAQREEEAVT